MQRTFLDYLTGAASGFIFQYNLNFYFNIGYLISKWIFVSTFATFFHCALDLFHCQANTSGNDVKLEL